uniref:Uncharacterized protein n=1 Tax=viral metagenome TaxID=1070528 RepID=A0A6C0J7S0_9ZZZZ
MTSEQKLECIIKKSADKDVFNRWREIKIFIKINLSGSGLIVPPDILLLDGMGIQKLQKNYKVILM